MLDKEIIPARLSSTNNFLVGTSSGSVVQINQNLDIHTTVEANIKFSAQRANKLNVHVILVDTICLFQI